MFRPNGALCRRGALLRGQHVQHVRWHARWRPDGAQPTTRFCQREPGELRGGVGKGEAAGFSPQQASGDESKEGSMVVPSGSSAPVIGGGSGVLLQQ
jgi:hypothetical protein